MTTTTAVGQNNVGYVPQQIYLCDDSVMHNIAFGIPKELIDIQACRSAARIANIDDFVTNELPNADDTIGSKYSYRNDSATMMMSVKSTSGDERLQGGNRQRWRSGAE